MIDKPIEPTQWHRAAMAAWTRLTPKAKATAKTLETMMNGYSHVATKPPGGQALRVDDLEELIAEHIIRRSGEKTGFIQMNPELWPPSLESRAWALERWKGNDTRTPEQRKDDEFKRLEA